MASTNQLFIFGLFLTFTTITVATTPAYLLTESFLECRERSSVLLAPVMHCLSDQFSPDKVNETARLYSDTTACLYCKHVCRTREQIWECMRQGVESMKDFSNKSKTMIPSSVQLFKNIVNYFCDSEDEMFLGLTDEDMNCLKNSWDECKSNLDFIRNMDAVALCEFEDPDATNLYTMEYVCKESNAYLDCSRDNVLRCHSRVYTAFLTLKAVLLIGAPCGKYDIEVR
ncbi:uncharacterized protein LOC124154387 isoform X3 [Ischnura elegans]|uniref:uncharacterized protein LOC124154387 isoform X3 n=1 Tax=Ischnura elegans TaxID=197161 RepID=UPI001ED86A77|nr:uncharacterized protein LOC124154387 isoform X3 [Ischnura elegans]